MGTGACSRTNSSIVYGSLKAFRPDAHEYNPDGAIPSRVRQKKMRLSRRWLYSSSSPSTRALAIRLAFVNVGAYVRIWPGGEIEPQGVLMVRKSGLRTSQFSIPGV